MSGKQIHTKDSYKLDFKSRKTYECINPNRSNKKPLNREIQAYKSISEFEWFSKHIDMKRKIEVQKSEERTQNKDVRTGKTFWNNRQI